MGVLAVSTRAAVLVTVLLCGACQGESEGGREVVPVPAGPRQVPHESYIQVGYRSGERPRAIDNPYDASKEAIREGEQLYAEYNCKDCHGGEGSGGMCPSLSDSRWRYGGSPAEIYQSIHEGRPLGMPAWGEALPEDQIWKLVAYLRSLSVSDGATVNWLKGKRSQPPQP